jgi:predicted nuclease of predicted toxin-antitoxin system
MRMRFLIDECLHPSLVGAAHAAGFDATHINYLDLGGKPDRLIAERIIKDELVFVTNNGADFIRLLGKVELHPGLIVLVPNVRATIQRALFKAALEHSAERDLINTVLEIDLQTIREYQLPGT